MSVKEKNIVQLCVTKPIVDECSFKWTVENFVLLKHEFGQCLLSKEFSLNLNIDYTNYLCIFTIHWHDFPTSENYIYDYEPLNSR